MDTEKFTERLKVLRGSRTQNQVATEMNISNLSSITQQTLGRYENGERLPNAEILCDIAEYYDCSVDYLLGRSDTKSPDIIIDAAHRQTGLSEEAINILSKCEYKNTLDYIIRSNEFSEIVRLICIASCFRELMHFSDQDKLTLKKEIESNKDLHSLSAYIILGLPDDGLSSSYKTRINELSNKLFDNLISEKLDNDNIWRDHNG